MTRISYKTSKVLICTILCGLPKLDQVTGFNDLDRKIIEAKVEENYKKKSTFTSIICWTKSLNPAT